MKLLMGGSNQRGRVSLAMMNAILDVLSSDPVLPTAAGALIIL